MMVLVLHQMKLNKFTFLKNNCMNKSNTRKSFLIIMLFSVGFLISCNDKDIYFDNNQTLESQVWNASNDISFDFDINDSVQKFDFYLNLRTTTSYEWSNIYVFMKLEGPNNLVAFDTVAIDLADLTGKWYGKVSGSMVENHILFMKNVRFPQQGKHTITLNQGMRDTDLNEIVDV